MAKAPQMTRVALIQGKDGQIRRVRIGDQEVAVLHAGPTVADGQMGVTMTLVGVEVVAEKAEKAEETASGA